MQMTMTLENCCRCGLTILPGEPAMQTASVDIVDGRAVSTPVRFYHLRGGSESAAKERQPAPQAA